MNQALYAVWRLVGIIIDDVFEKEVWSCSNQRNIIQTIECSFQYTESTHIHRFVYRTHQGLLGSPCLAGSSWFLYPSRTIGPLLILVYFQRVPHWPEQLAATWGEIFGMCVGEVTEKTLQSDPKRAGLGESQQKAKDGTVVIPQTRFRHIWI